MDVIIENSSFLKQHKEAFIRIEGIDRIKLSASYIREQIKAKKSISGMIPKEIENKVMDTYK